MSQELYVATLDTRHYSFEAYGDSAAAVMDTLIAGFRHHAHQYGVSADIVREWIADAEVRAVRFGVAYRDHAPIVVKIKGVTT